MRALDRVRHAEVAALGARDVALDVQEVLLRVDLVQLGLRGVGRDVGLVSVMRSPIASDPVAPRHVCTYPKPLDGDALAAQPPGHLFPLEHAARGLPTYV